MMCSLKGSSLQNAAQVRGPVVVDSGATGAIDSSGRYSDVYAPITVGVGAALTHRGGSVYTHSSDLNLPGKLSLESTTGDLVPDPALPGKITIPATGSLEKRSPNTTVLPFRLDNSGTVDAIGGVATDRGMPA